VCGFFLLCFLLSWSLNHYFHDFSSLNIHELKLSDFAATSDSNCKMYVYMTTDELTKNHRDDENSASARMYARDGEC
jgi:hypothetical protein